MHARCPNQLVYQQFSGSLSSQSWLSCIKIGAYTNYIANRVLAIQGYFSTCAARARRQCRRQAQQGPCAAIAAAFERDDGDEAHRSGGDGGGGKARRGRGGAAAIVSAACAGYVRNCEPCPQYLHANPVAALRLCIHKGARRCTQDKPSHWSSLPRQHAAELI